jgi:hypothetical protein
VFVILRQREALIGGSLAALQSVRPVSAWADPPDDAFGAAEG